MQLYKQLYTLYFFSDIFSTHLAVKTALKNCSNSAELVTGNIIKGKKVFMDRYRQFLSCKFFLFLEKQKENTTTSKQHKEIFLKERLTDFPILWSK